MPGFLFWNLKNKPLQREVAALARERAADIIVLAEYDGTDEELLSELNEGGVNGFSAIPKGLCERIRIFSRISGSNFEQLEASSRYTIHRIGDWRPDPIILVSVHLPSKRNRSDEDQLSYAIGFSDTIRKIEEREGHQRTLLLGDLNMNPFESGMVNAKGLHAVMSQVVAREESRIVDGIIYPYFYNPMWNFFGDFTPGPSGTIFHRDCYRSFFWNMFDQVLIRPSLLDGFDIERLTILTEIDGTTLLRENGRPNDARFSDHLPISFRLEFQGDET